MLYLMLQLMLKFQCASIPPTILRPVYAQYTSTETSLDINSDTSIDIIYGITTNVNIGGPDRDASIATTIETIYETGTN